MGVIITAVCYIDVLLFVNFCVGIMIEELTTRKKKASTITISAEQIRIIFFDIPGSIIGLYLHVQI